MHGNYLIYIIYMDVEVAETFYEQDSEYNQSWQKL